MGIIIGFTAALMVGIEEYSHHAGRVHEEDW